MKSLFKLYRISIQQLYRKAKNNFDNTSDIILFFQVITVVSLLPILLRLFPLSSVIRRFTVSDVSLLHNNNRNVFFKKLIKYVDYIFSLNIGIYNTNCLKRSIVIYYFLNKKSVNVELKLGVKKHIEKNTETMNPDLQGHAWLMIDNKPFNAHPTLDIKSYTVTATFPGAIKKKHLSLPPEHALLLVCAQYHLKTTYISHIDAAIKTCKNWDVFKNLVREHKLVDCASELATTKHASLIPRQFSNLLREDNHQFIAKSMLLSSEIVRITRALSELNIQAITYKGAALSQILFNHPNKRHYKDIDLFINHSDLSKITVLLISLGYRSRLKLDWEHSFICEKTKNVIDLHWELTSNRFPLNLSFNEAWRQTRPLLLHKEVIHTFTNEYTFIVHCINAAKDDWYSIGQIYEIGLITISLNLDWHFILLRANIIGVRRVVLIAINLVEIMFSLTPSITMKKAIYLDPISTSLSYKILNRIINPPSTEGDVITINFLRANSREGLRFRIPYYKKILMHASIPNEKDFQTIKLSESLYPLYWLIRPARLVKKYFLKQ